MGMAGKINKRFMHNVIDGDAFIIDLDGDVLLAHKTMEKRFEPLHKISREYSRR